MNAMKDKPTRGIAPQRASSPERVSVASRLSRPVYEAVSASAQLSGKSLSEEIEQRLENSVKSIDLVSQLFGTSPVAIELLKSLSQTFHKIRNIAINKGLSEAETRLALRSAFDRIGDVYFWREGQEPYTGPTGSMDKPPVHTADKPPGDMGWEIAEWSMFWNDDLMREEFEAGRLSNVWSGDGRESVIAVEREPRPPLELRGDTGPGAIGDEDADPSAFIEGADQIGRP
jgi:hypothetical protein